MFGSIFVSAPSFAADLSDYANFRAIRRLRKATSIGAGGRAKSVVRRSSDMTIRGPRPTSSSFRPTNRRSQIMVAVSLLNSDVPRFTYSINLVTHQLASFLFGWCSGRNDRQPTARGARPRPRTAPRIPHNSLSAPGSSLVSFDRVEGEGKRPEGTEGQVGSAPHRTATARAATMFISDVEGRSKCYCPPARVEVGLKA